MGVFAKKRKWFLLKPQFDRKLIYYNDYYVQFCMGNSFELYEPIIEENFHNILC